jgi:transposase InsO family protein
MNSTYGDPSTGYRARVFMPFARAVTFAQSHRCREPFLRHTRCLVMDRHTKYSAAFRAALTRERIEPIRLPPRSPNLNAYAERFVLSVKTECTQRMVFFGRSSLERALTHYLAHSHEERNHQGLQNHLLRCSDGVSNNSNGSLQWRGALDELSPPILTRCFALSSRCNSS